MKNLKPNQFKDKALKKTILQDKTSMKTLNSYEWTFRENKYHFITDKHCVYDILFEYSDKFFDEHCTSCKDIFELTINCLSHDCPIFDKRVGVTICNILSEFLSESCNGVMYRCYDKDNRQLSRNLKFDRWYEEFDIDERIEKYSQEFCSDECETYYLLVDKGCEKYPIIIHDFNYRCKECDQDDEIIEYQN